MTGRILDQDASLDVLTSKKTVPSRSGRQRVGFVMPDSDDDDSVQCRRQVKKDFMKMNGQSESQRLNAPRMSLLGKPISFRPQNRRDAKFRKLQSKIYNFLERPTGWQACLYHLHIFLLIFTCLLLSILATIDDMNEVCNQLVYAMELLLLVILSIECILRVWSAGCRSRFQGKMGRMRFIRQPLCILDIVVVVSTIFIFVVGSDRPDFVFHKDALRGLRFLQFLRLVRLDRRGNTWKLLGSVVWAHRQELLTTTYISFLALIAISFSVFALEHDKNQDHQEFDNLPDSLYYGLITLTTIGYGDKTPSNWSGKLVCTLFAILGASFFALPAGILGSGFALQVQQQQRQKHFARRRHPAAQLIQCLWRCYAADPNSISAATWKLHLRPVSSPTTGSFRTNTLISRLSIKRNHGNNSPMPHRGERGSKKLPSSHDNDDTNEKKYMANGSHLGHCTDSVRSKAGDDHDETEKIIKLEEKHKNAIRAIRKIRYFVARRKFKEALRPYDVKDVIEQYSAGHTDMLARIKSLQANLDQTLGKPVQERRKGRIGSIDVFDPSMSLNTRVTRVERKMNLVDRKLDMLIDLYRDDNQRHGRRSDSSIEGAICEMSGEGAGSGGGGGGGNGGEAVKELIDIASSPKGFKRRSRVAYSKPSTLEIQDEPSSTSSMVTPVESISAIELLQQLSTSQPLLSPPPPPTPPYTFSSVFHPTFEVTASGTEDQATAESPLIDVPLVSFASSKEETDTGHTLSEDTSVPPVVEDRETRI